MVSDPTPSSSLDSDRSENGDAIASVPAGPLPHGGMDVFFWTPQRTRPFPAGGQEVEGGIQIVVGYSCCGCCWQRAAQKRRSNSAGRHEVRRHMGITQENTKTAAGRRAAAPRRPPCRSRSAALAAGRQWSGGGGDQHEHGASIDRRRPLAGSGSERKVHTHMRTRRRGT